MSPRPSAACASALPIPLETPVTNQLRMIILALLVGATMREPPPGRKPPAPPDAWRVDRKEAEP